MAEMFADVLKARGNARTWRDSALDSYVAKSERDQRIDREFGQRGQRRDPMSAEAVGTLTTDELRLKYPSLRGSMGLFAGQRGAEFARALNDGTPTGAPVTFVQGSAPEGDL